MQNIVDVTMETAQQWVIDESFKRPVLVDFWADWCGPCKTLTPILEKLANEYQGQFLLAKINADDQQTLAGQFGVRSLPTVMLIKDGQPLDGFGGAQPETEVRALLEKHLPKPWEGDLQQAQALLAQGQAQDALPLLRQVYELAGEPPQVACLMAQALVDLKRPDEAGQLLDTVKLADQDALYEQVKAQLALSEQAAKTPELEGLEAALEQNPDDLDARYKLALQQYQEGYHRPALENLMAILTRDKNYAEGGARKTLMDILASLGKGDPLAVEFQRKLFTLLY
ncbi:thioredoxin [Marinimicrobium alkaliphilum]|uniref:thioredoxin n=1 Tax=Marinimicrobium alkaliphilum TaxID=2202654 RepID=UPI000DB9C141|nr:thioredoxin [Marinimicrobium alkaliphilum]